VEQTIGFNDEASKETLQTYTYNMAIILNKKNRLFRQPGNSGTPTPFILFAQNDNMD
jgi:hypothetical protein